MRQGILFKKIFKISKRDMYKGEGQTQGEGKGEVQGEG